MAEINFSTFEPSAHILQILFKDVFNETYLLVGSVKVRIKALLRFWDLFIGALYFFPNDEFVELVKLRV